MTVESDININSKGVFKSMRHYWFARHFRS